LIEGINTANTSTGRIIVTGNKELDRILSSRRGPLLVYGEAGSGKTNFALYVSALNSTLNRKVLYINTEGWIIKARITGLSKYWDMNRIEFIDLNNFRQQTLFILRHLPRIIYRYDIIVVDTINNLYRIEEDLDAATRALSTQMAVLYTLSSRLSRTIIVLGQVKAEDEREEVSGSTYIRFWSTTIARLEKDNPRRMIIEKPVEKEFFFEITGRGIKWIHT